MWPERPTCTVASFYVTNLLVFVGPEEIMLDQRGRQSAPCARVAESWRRIGSVSQMRQSWPILPHHGHRRRSNAFEKVIAPSHARAAPVPVVQCLVTAPLVKVAGWPHPALGCGGSTPPALPQCQGTDQFEASRGAAPSSPRGFLLVKNTFHPILLGTIGR